MHESVESAGEDVRVGGVDALWRYPVKSMAGEVLDDTELSSLGVVGDRAWAVRDEVRGGIRGAKKLPELMQLSARYLDVPTDASAPVEIRLPDGSRVGSSDPDVHGRVSAAIGHEVTLWPRLPADQLDHYRRGAPTHPDMKSELRALFARTPDEPLPDLSRLPPELLEFESPPGTYFDAFPLLVMSRSSLEALSKRASGSRFDVRRFRPNLVVGDTDPERPFPELDWIGRTLIVGSAALRIAMACPRCVMTTHGFGDLPKDPSIMRTLVREAEGCLGVYAKVERPGRVTRGDAVTLRS